MRAAIWPNSLLGLRHTSASRRDACHSRQVWVRAPLAPGRLGYLMAVAGMTLPNEASVGLHRAMGFEPVWVAAAPLA